MDAALDQVAQAGQGTVFVVADLRKFVRRHALQNGAHRVQRQPCEVGQLAHELRHGIHRMGLDGVAALRAARLV